MLNKHQTNQRDQKEIVVLEDLVPSEHLVRKVYQIFPLLTVIFPKQLNKPAFHRCVESRLVFIFSFSQLRTDASIPYSTAYSVLRLITSVIRMLFSFLLFSQIEI